MYRKQEISKTRRQPVVYRHFTTIGTCNTKTRVQHNNACAYDVMLYFIPFVANA